MYQEYMLKMKQMAEETKNVENNMRSYANTINSLLNVNN
jgi:hypothetical protein